MNINIRTRENDFISITDEFFKFSDNYGKEVIFPNSDITDAYFTDNTLNIKTLSQKYSFFIVNSDLSSFDEFIDHYKINDYKEDLIDGSFSTMKSKKTDDKITFKINERSKLLLLSIIATTIFIIYTFYDFNTFFTKTNMSIISIVRSYISFYNYMLLAYLFSIIGYITNKAFFVLVAAILYRFSGIRNIIVFQYTIVQFCLSLFISLRMRRKSKRPTRRFDE
ncbi:MAG: hypothetical protein GXZ08_07360 [Tissierellia bacterium]|nr:hypothetical protein [Tissierellia bacterium]